MILLTKIAVQRNVIANYKRLHLIVRLKVYSSTLVFLASSGEQITGNKLISV